MLSRLRSRSSTPAPTEQDALAALRKQLDTHPAATTPEATVWLTDDCLLRYLRARSLSVKKALDIIVASLQWRASYQPAQLWSLYEDSLRTEAASGKMYVLPNVDRQGQAVIVMRPGLENSSDPVGNVRYLVYTLERAAALSKNGKYTVIVDYLTGNVSMSTCPSFSVMKETTHILQHHYPERLGAMFFYDAPKFILGMLKMLKPFIDPVTREKLFFPKRATASEDEDCKRLLDLENTPEEYGGSMRYEFDCNQYFDIEQVK